MSTLSGRTPASTFGNLIQVEGGVTSTIKEVSDGSGVLLPIRVTSGSNGKFITTGDLLPVGGVSVCSSEDFANQTNYLGQIAIHSGDIHGSGIVEAVSLHGPVTSVYHTGNSSLTELKTRFDDESVYLPNNSIWNFSLKVLASNGDFSKVAAWNVSGVIKKESTSLSTAFIGTPGSTSLTTIPSGWSLTISANTSNGSLKVEGQSGTDVADWACFYEILQLKPLASGSIGTGTGTGI